MGGSIFLTAAVFAVRLAVFVILSPRAECLRPGKLRISRESTARFLRSDCRRSGRLFTAFLAGSTLLLWWFTWWIGLANRKNA